MIDTVYIISWFGDNENRERRKRFHEKQIAWLLERDMNIVILPQFYDPGDFIYHDKIKYLDNQSPGKLLYGGGARNILLKDFYNNDNDYALLADNDCIIESVFSGDTFIDEMNLNTDLYKDITLASAASIPVNVGLDHRKQMRKKDGYHWFIPSVRVHNAFTIFRNIVKDGNEPIYNDSELRVGEDVDFNIKLVLAGYKTYVFGNLIFKEFGGMNAFSTWEPEYDKRKIYYKEHANLMLKRYAKNGLYAKPNGNPNYDAFLLSYGIDEKIIKIGSKVSTNIFME